MTDHLKGLLITFTGVLFILPDSLFVRLIGTDGVTVASVVKTYPLPDATDVEPTVWLSCTFSHSRKAVARHIESGFRLFGGTRRVLGTFTWRHNHKVLEFKPLLSLMSSTFHTLTLPARYGALDESLQFTFRTTVSTTSGI